jgi:hypothetical protein
MNDGEELVARSLVEAAAAHLRDNHGRTTWGLQKGRRWPQASRPVPCGRAIPEMARRHGRPGRNFRPSAATPCHTPMSHICSMFVPRLSHALLTFVPFVPFIPCLSHVCLMFVPRLSRLSHVCPTLVTFSSRMIWEMSMSASAPRKMMSPMPDLKGIIMDGTAWGVMTPSPRLLRPPRLLFPPWLSDCFPVCGCSHRLKRVPGAGGSVQGLTGECHGQADHVEK